MDRVRRALGRSVPASYAPLIERMRFFIQPEVSCARFFAEACFGSDGNRTALGDTVAAHAAGGLFIDVPCGLHAAREAGDPEVLPVAARLGYTQAWEIDLTADVVGNRVPQTLDVLHGGYRLADGIGAMGMRAEYGMSVATMQDDLLGFVAKTTPTDPTPILWYVSALQPDAAALAEPSFPRDIAVPYLTALYDELARVCREHDLIILNSAAMLVAGIDDTQFPGLHPLMGLGARGFRLLRTCPRNKVQVFTMAPVRTGPSR